MTPFQVDVSSNSGGSWTPALNIATGTLPGHWTRMSLNLQQFIQLTSQVQVRFRARDQQMGSIVEAAVDELVISSLSIPAGVEEPFGQGQERAPIRLVLSPPVPNPATGSCRISYVLPSAGPVDLSLYSIAGRLERTLARGEVAAGRHSLVVEDALPPGIYWLRLVTGSGERTQRLTVIR